MAITANPLSSAYDGLDFTSYKTSIITPGANRLVLLALAVTRGGSAGLPPQPTIDTDTWVLVRTLNYDSAGATQSAIFVFRSMSASPPTGQRTIDFGGVTCSSCSHSVVEFAGVDTTGSDGSGAIVQAVDSGAGLSDVQVGATLAALGSASNATHASSAHQANEATDPKLFSPYVELHDVNGASPALGFQTEWAINDTGPGTSWTTSSPCGLVAVEIKASGGAPPSTDVLSPQTFRGRGI
jgi:hypothetical protein